MNDLIETVNFTFSSIEKNNGYIGNSKNKKASKSYTALLFIDDIYANWKDILYSFVNNSHIGSVEWALSPLHNPNLDEQLDENPDLPEEHKKKLHYHINLDFPIGVKDYECKWLMNRFYRSHSAPMPQAILKKESAFKYLVHYGLLHKQQFPNGLDEIEVSPYYKIPVFDTHSMDNKEMLIYLMENEIYDEVDLLMTDTQQAKYIQSVMNNNKLLYSAWKKAVAKEIEKNTRQNPISNLYYRYNDN